MDDEEQKQHLTKEKYEELKDELAKLTSTGRKEIAESLEYAKSLGDLSENAEYHQAREKQAQLESRVAHLEAILKSAVIVEPKKGATIDVGSTATIVKTGEKEERVYTLVGSEEANTSLGKLSESSPIGASLIGKKKGDVIKVSTPGGEVEYRVEEVK
jgi:transcription elongation factor GreA